MSQSNPTFGQMIAGVAIIGVVAVLMFQKFFGGDRAVVTRCIDVMLEAARGRAGYSELLDLSRQVDAAQEIVITSREDNQIGSGTLTHLEFTIDGRPERMTCGM